MRRGKEKGEGGALQVDGRQYGRKAARVVMVVGDSLTGGFGPGAQCDPLGWDATRLEAEAGRVPRADQEAQDVKGRISQLNGCWLLIASAMDSFCYVWQNLVLVPCMAPRWAERIQSRRTRDFSGRTILGGPGWPLSLALSRP